MRLLFALLRSAGYEWQPQTPDLLLKFRKNPFAFRALSKFFGLGLPLSWRNLLDDGLSERALDLLINEKFLVPASTTNSSEEILFKSTMAVSGSGEIFIVHDHWPPNQSLEGGYVHYGAESAWLSRACNRDLEGFIGKRILDLGCSSGALALEVVGVAETVLGLDISERAIYWGNILKAAHGIRSMKLECAAIGSKEADHIVSVSGEWDTAIMNPPMVIPSHEASYPHRDGGKLGIEFPLLFLDFSYRHLRQGGEVLTLVTNPIIKGKPAFFDAFDKTRWEFIEKRCLHPHFNQSVARKQGYFDQGITNIELWFLHLKKH